MPVRSLLNYVPYTPNVPYVPYVPLKNYVSTCLVNKTKTGNNIIKLFEKML